MQFPQACLTIPPAAAGQVFATPWRINSTNFDKGQDIDEARDFAMEYNVSAVPTFLLIKNGELVATTGALHSEEELLKFIQPMLS